MFNKRSSLVIINDKYVSLHDSITRYSQKYQNVNCLKMYPGNV